MIFPQIYMYQGTQVRMVMKSGEPRWVAKDVCEILEIGNSTDVVNRLDEDEVDSIEVTDSLGRKQKAKCVTEGGLYSLIIGSRKPEAKAFKRWITHEVLPTIRQTGSYSVAQFSLPQSLPEALRLLATEIEEKETIKAENEQHKQELATAAPKLALYDTAMNAGNNKAVGTVAKMLGIGRNKLFELLRNKKILRSNNEPYQEYIDRGYFQVRLYPLPHSNGDIENKQQTMVTPKGIDYINKILQADKQAN